MVAPIDLATIAAGRGRTGFVVYGEESGDNLGTFITTAGDIDGDGFDDLVIGAYRADATRGTAYVVFGKAGGFGAVIDLSAMIASAAGFVMHGITAGDFFGGAGGTVGDFNGDGFGDLVVGAGSAGGTGESYVVFGTSRAGFGTQIDLQTLIAGNGSAGFVVRGESAGDVAAFVASAGDVNGDGFDDLIIGAPFANGENGGNFASGSTYVVFGTNAKRGATLDLGTITNGNGSKGFVIRGEKPYDFSGWGVASAGDVNGDGFGDVIIGAHGADSSTRGGRTGASYVVFGKNGGFGATIDLTTIASGNGTAGFVVIGQDANDAAGFSVSSAGDINGDGFADLLIGTDSGDGVGNLKQESGSSYVLFGKSSGFAPVVDLANTASGNGTAGFEIFGEDSLDLAGWRVSNGGDVNGDGFDDILIGAPAADAANDAKAYAGSTYVVFGKAGGFGPSLNLTTIAAGIGGFVIHGEDAGDRAGWNIGSAGDINGDGFDDLAVGAIWNAGSSNMASQAGAAYVIFGRDFAGTVTHSGTARAETLTGTAGADVIVAGRGNDLILGNGGIDALNGGAGKDRIAISDFSFRRIDGGSGFDTLLLSGAGHALDLREIPNSRLQNIEAIDLTGSGNNRLTLTALEVVNLSDTTNTLQVLGNTGDAVTFADFGWTVGGLAGGFRTYKQGAAKVLVAEGIDTFMVPAPADGAGNTLATARVVTLGSTPASFTDYIGPTDVSDYYQFSISGQANFKLNLTGLSANLDVCLLDSNGALLRGRTQDGIADEAITVNSLAAGSYYIQVYQGATGATSNYALALSAVPAPLSAATIFADGGTLPFLAKFAASAYHLSPYEVRSSTERPTNDFSQSAEDAHLMVSSKLRWLTAADLPTLTPRSVSDPDFPVFGLDDGVFLNGNAGALVGRSRDALFVSVRGTNDNAAGYGPTQSLLSVASPDVNDWTGLGRNEHFDLLEPLRAAVENYVLSDASIKFIYITGHSLGASMIEAWMDQWSDSRVEAVTFASPGYGIPLGDEDSRITNIWIDGDAIEIAAFLQENEGDRNEIYNNLSNKESISGVDRGTLLHSIDLYVAYMNFFKNEGIDLNEIRNVGVDFDNLYANINVVDAQNRIFRIGDLDDALTKGGIGSDLVLGGDGADQLIGYGGRDRLQGGRGQDVLDGGPGADTLLGGQDADEMTGNIGSDRFRYLSPLEGGDTITDFVSNSNSGIFSARDFIEVSAAGFGSGLFPGMELEAAGRFVNGLSANQPIGQFLYDMQNKALWWDSDGSNTAQAPSLVAIFTNQPMLGPEDFLVIA